MWERRLVVLSVGLLVFWALATVLAVAQGWPAEFNGLGDPTDVGGEWVSRGTLVSPPVFPIAVQIALTLIAFLDRRLMLGIAGFGLAILGAVYAIAGFGEPFDPENSDPPTCALRDPQGRRDRRIARTRLGGRRNRRGRDPRTVSARRARRRRAGARPSSAGPVSEDAGRPPLPASPAPGAERRHFQRETAAPEPRHTAAVTEGPARPARERTAAGRCRRSSPAERPPPARASRRSTSGRCAGTGTFDCSSSARASRCSARRSRSSPSRTRLPAHRLAR